MYMSIFISLSVYHHVVVFNVDSLSISFMFPISGLSPLSDSFDLLRESYIEELRFNHSFIPGFASYMQNNVFNDMYMGYCVQSEQVTCETDEIRYVVCKIPCKQAPVF